MLRLKTWAQFQSVLAGPIVSKTNHFALHRIQAVATLPVSDDTNRQAVLERLFLSNSTWIGAIVPKRWAKHAVTRNTIKRQIYCAGESFGDILSADAYVVRLRKKFDKSIFISATSDALKHAVRVEVELLLSRVAC